MIILTVLMSRTPAEFHNVVNIPNVQNVYGMKLLRRAKSQQTMMKVDR